MGNAADAVELLAISYILPQLPEITSAQKGPQRGGDSYVSCRRCLCPLVE